MSKEGVLSIHGMGGRGPELLAVHVIFAVFTTVIIVCRVYVRVGLVKWFGLDDYFAIAGWLVYTIYNVLGIIGVFYGVGQHIAHIQPPENIAIAFKWWFICEAIYVVSNMLVKFSVGIMLLRLLTERIQRILVWAALALLEIYSLVSFLVSIFQCKSPSFFWTRFQGDTSGSCIDESVLLANVYVYSGITIVVDLVFAVTPWFMVRKLQMNPRTKLLVSIILALGSIASAATIIRTPYIATMSDKADFLYGTTDVAIWSCAETGISIVASCAATLKPLFKTFLQHSHLWGRSSEPNTPRAWRNNNRASYIRSGSASQTLHQRQSHQNDGDIEMGSKTNILKTTEVDIYRVRDES